MKQRVEDKSCHRYEVLVAGLALFQKIYRLHRSVPDFLASMGMFKSLRADLATVQTD